MQEEADSDFVHREGFGKGQGFASEAAQALAQRVVETLDVIVNSLLGGIHAMLLSGQDVVIALQMIGVQPTLAVSERDALSKEPGGSVIARPERVSHDRTSAPAQGLATTRARPGGDGPRSSITHPVPGCLGAGREPGWSLKAARGRLFLSHWATVLRDTPKIRVNPRNEARS